LPKKDAEAPAGPLVEVKESEEEKEEEVIEEK
jgi:hypothetical protein